MVMKIGKKIIAVLGLCFIVGAITSCSTTNPTSTEMNLQMPPIANSIQSHDDIALPSEMEWDYDKSMAIRTASFIGGLYHYSGRVEVNSLKEFIKTSMANNKWKLVGEASYEKMLLAFMKPNKTCMITISESFGGPLGVTHVDLSITVDLAAAKGLNPFGEPVN